jgi:hypothetical protein
MMPHPLCVGIDCCDRIDADHRQGEAARSDCDSTACKRDSRASLTTNSFRGPAVTWKKLAALRQGADIAAARL